MPAALPDVDLPDLARARWRPIAVPIRKTLGQFVEGVVEWVSERVGEGVFFAACVVLFMLGSYWVVKLLIDFFRWLF